MQAARKKSKIMYEGHHVMFFQDISTELHKKRKRFDVVKQRLRDLKIDYGIIYPAKLRLLHKGKPCVFADPAVRRPSPQQTTAKNRALATTVWYTLRSRGGQISNDRSLPQEVQSTLSFAVHRLRVASPVQFLVQLHTKRTFPTVMEGAPVCNSLSSCSSSSIPAPLHLLSSSPPAPLLLLFLFTSCSFSPPVLLYLLFLFTSCSFSPPVPLHLLFLFTSCPSSSSPPAPLLLLFLLSPPAPLHLLLLFSSCSSSPSTKFPDVSLGEVPLGDQASSQI
ncbi:hypothetical protein L3Q82_010102 [Scortum barcoo]|uniref:Uncharacterized protein n=1 Tax=Scortum barcoo TaxID=214431 RepID=A0ACB8WBG8_9TELE|nr:hypothetical protein L3Q82_010102 [Scortum barcoo]